MNNTRKRRSKDGDHPNCVQPPKMPVSVPSSEGALRVTADQLIELWCYDNECGRKYVKGCPLRTCSKVSELQVQGHSSVDDSGLTLHEMTVLKSSILDMWKQAGTLFEIFIDMKEECEGYRLRVRNDLAAKVSIKQQDAIIFGWIAHIPTALSECHVFKRSCTEPNGYLGGPLSYLNWCRPSNQHVTILKSINNPSICKMSTSRNLPAGTELRWNYGCSQYMPDSGVWFEKECCSVSHMDPTEQKRHGQNDTYRSHCYRELCVLCGFPYSISNKENRVQRKQHLIGLHADFLGSSWDGCGFYDQQIVELNNLYCRADELNHLLGALKRMNWNVFPACKIFSQEYVLRKMVQVHQIRENVLKKDSDRFGTYFHQRLTLNIHWELKNFGDDEATVLREFSKRREILYAGGTLVLRGTEVPTKIADFQPVEPRPWKVISWKNGEKPHVGRFAVPADLKYDHDLRLQELLSSFCQKYLQCNKC